ncbi:hypothetical protein A3A55_00750 [Candidatus Roizmanbacteria bacterium RIFCSPLOWO2_01_FULL_40_14]|uniref:Peptidase A2 domain-containing protein n=3 Tax=Candidatus Roizmaniibacteriota TaxID=1752723 RepID=A0A0G1A8I1_9BACT|nr:MAG: hypothetical protein UT85_C0005G0032 [Candidatus Levybacteria bacterium GW2011_GWA2_40_16]KKR72497.1 MAG: hypothetical protein UU14_C0005G0065 [Candidatus Roizmanbacteria bacterium GW2011_GWB1_40_7]KKR94024.1 MAG: hypothetical protein UU41_C0014G0002 [Candidatus Roizmanbacteria bacterium GW2011_GWA1_41_13]KKS21603.1 MAG: hypothetical protein UU78_C0035G0020 [Candidatus Roizmanbacteria bacterium GW2011_GWC2_41_7]OGK50456.1 MAG: hypothetical protein A3A55_00750 [Candidatus Roizmanbacteria
MDLWDNFFFLVDSGADNTYADLNIAVWLGIELEKVKPKTSFGANYKAFVSYPAKTALSIDGYSFTLPIYYTKNFGTRAIIGQEIFFDRFKIVFERYEWKLTMLPK